jgi:lipid A ethanolaminephosphotransferase
MNNINNNRHSLFSVTPTQLIFLSTAFWMLFANFSFYHALLADYPLSENIGFLASVIIGFSGVIVLALALLCHRYTMKPLLIALFVTSAFAAYFMDSYHVLIDTDMIRNALSTDSHETTDLLSPSMLVYVLLLGVLPSLYIYRTAIRFQPLRAELWSRAKLIAATLGVMALIFFLNSASFSSFFREHKAIRYHFNPVNYVFATGKYISRSLKSEKKELVILGTDAAIPKTDTHRELIIMVVGETARADRFSLNGYARETNPRLKNYPVVSFTDFESCGTSTAISVPCMFSHKHAAEFDVGEAKTTENVLDILHHAGIPVLWRDNNSSSKGVADRVTYQDYRNPDVNPVCDVECRDEGMLVGLQDYIDAQPSGDVMIVLHQMGNHGPAYYKRYPKAFEKFTPVCRTNELSACSEEEINNAYDNAILYTDYFLSKVIELLKANDAKFETAMLYVSDHGESLGENGLYLHGMPNFIAPESQRHVPVIMWVGKNFDEISYEELAAKRHQPFSHDAIFHTLLGLMEVETDLYDPNLSLLE